MSKLTVQNVQVTTAAVEVKTLTISGKQVTLAVFRQLIQEPLVDYQTGHMAGIAWGTVNYHPDRCGDGEDDHVHVVWQKGDQLRRSWEKSPDLPGPFDIERSLTAAWLDLAIIDGWRSDREVKGHRRPEEIPVFFGAGQDRGSVWVAVDEHQRDALWPRDLFSDQRQMEEDREKAISVIRARRQPGVETYGAGVCEREVAGVIEKQISANQEIRRRKDQHWREIQDLPQLFIAV